MNFITSDNKHIYVYCYEEVDNPRGVVQISHGMAEHAKRYENFARKLNEAGYIVYANDHRGHGKSVSSNDELGIVADSDGFNKTVDDMHVLTLKIKEKYPELPIVLFGHSMGSFLVQKYIMLYGKDVDLVILSGSNGSNPKVLSYIATKMARGEVKKLGRETKSEKMDKLFFSSYNKRIKANRTKFDWLSRDDVEVDKYIADPFCGFLFSAGAYLDLVLGIISIDSETGIEKVPKNLPIYIVSGDMDPVCNYGKGVRKLTSRYKKHGITNVELKLYQGARHEVLNEKNKDEVIDGIVTFIEKYL